MGDLLYSEMLNMQRELWEKNKDSWSPLEPSYARSSLLWMIAEIGEAIDIIKKCGEKTIMNDEKIKESFTEELCDVLMYFNDVLLRYDISAADFSRIFLAKHMKNMNRSFNDEDEKFIDKLSK